MTGAVRALVPLLALLAGCLPASAPLPAPVAAPAFRPEAFFSGRTEGRGTLVVRGVAPRGLRVESRGAPAPDGTFRLDQTITFEDGRVQTRTWAMRALGGGRYTSTLTDAAGEVSAEAVGNAFHIRYRMRAGAVMEQWITLRPGGQTADNVATVRVLGVPWARLTEEITRVGG
ncbi:MAG TPA: DUF3833 family protein [Rubricoccaceae bacterium]